MQFREKQSPGLSAWLPQLAARAHHNVVGVALANKLARIAWAVLAKGEVYRPPIRFYSERQSSYAERFGLARVYPPQMVVDGTSEFVGSNSRLADKAFGEASRIPKIPVHLSSISLDGPNTLRAHLETGTLESSVGSRAADVYVAIALNPAESQVSAGENAGHKLAHVSVVRSLARIGTLREGQGFAHEVQIKLAQGSESSNLRLIAFIQEPHQRRVLGATSQLVSAKVRISIRCGAPLRLSLADLHF
ncbi:MAG: DUF1223 domain-containing protein [Terriglobales bacterium]